MFRAKYTFAHEDGPGADRIGDIEDMLDEQLDDENEDVVRALDVEFDVGGGCRMLLTGDHHGPAETPAGVLDQIHQ